MMSVRAVGHLFHQPSWLTVFHAFLLLLGDLAPTAMLNQTLRFEAEVRLAFVVSLLFHEVAHIAAAIPFLPTFAWRHAHLNVQGLILALVPTAPVPTCHVVLATSFTAGQELLVRSAGLLASLALVLLSVWLDVARPLLAGPVLALLGALLSDLPTGPLLGPKAPLGCFCCGNWGLLLAREALEARAARADGALPAACEGLLRSVLDIVELRGAQAGGCVTFLGTVRGQVEAVRSRTVKSKRGRLGVMLFRRFRWELMWRRLFKGLRRLPVVLVQGHSRFGTSSSPAVCETHPHQWLGRHTERVWRCDEQGTWSCRPELVCTTITHNGDYDGSALYDSTVPNGVLGEWLARVLGTKNGAKGDSPKLAGMMDLLLCQGMWLSSVRCAFVFTVLNHVDEAFGWEAAGPDAPSSVPGTHVFAEWAMAFDDAFQQLQIMGSFSATAENMRMLAAGAALRLGEGCKSNEGARLLQRFGLSGEVLSRFSREAVRLFFKRDVLAAVATFFKDAVGTFSVSVSCSLWPESIVIAAKGQPVSIAFDAEGALAFWSSEPNALDVPNTGRIAGASRRVAAARWDMNDAVGEAVELKVVHAAPEQALENDSGFFSLPGVATTGSRIVVRGISLEKSLVPLSRKGFMERWVRLRMPPPVHLASGEDPISADLQDVPAVLAELEDSWSDPTALNHMSGRRFAESLKALLMEPSGDPQDIDVLIFGIENSLWLAQQFAADLARLFPRLNITALSSNWVLGLLQKAQGQVEPLNFALPRERFTFKKRAIALAVSHSGTTYPTVWCTRLLAQRPEGLELFAMSGVLESVLANSVGLTKEEFSGTLFSTMAGVRPAEPSTVATLAMHHSFSLLLLTCADVVATAQWEREVSKRGKRRLLTMLMRSDTDMSLGEKAEGDRSELLCCLQPEDVKDFRRVVEALLPATQQLCGVSKEREHLSSQSRAELLRLGDYFSQQLLEGWYSTLTAAVYVYVTVTFGLPLLSSIWSAGKQRFLENMDSGDDPWFHGERLLDIAVAFCDAHLYVFFAALVATMHRLITGRRLFTRYTGRNIVLVESTANYKLLRAYVSKLGALAHRFTAFGVSGQNGLDHFVHEMTHRTTSEVILFVGRPDGRMGTLAAAERAVLLSIQQARFVASSANTGIEMVTVGHNPWQKKGLCVRDVVLPSSYRPDFISCELLQSGEGPQDPLDVCHRLATLGGEHRAPTSEAPFRWVSCERAQAEMGKQSVSFEDACLIVQRLVDENAQALGILDGAFDVTKVLQPPVPFSPTKSGASILTHSKSGASLTHRAGRNEGFTASDLVAVLRGRAMGHEIQHMQRQKLRVSHRGAGSQPDLAEGELRRVFESWAAQCSAHHERRGTLQIKCAEWRVQEEYRRRRRQWLSSYRTAKFGLRACFLCWRREAQRKAGAVQKLGSAAGRSSPAPSPSKDYPSPSKDYADLKKSGAPVGARRLRKIHTHEDFVAQLATVEKLYETRTAAAERLLAAFVVFHRAVRPVSKLWGLSFDMDRSESRLRVASTPAPVAFAEALEGRVYDI